MNYKNKLVLALDVPHAGRAFDIAREVGDVVDAIKVGNPLVLSAGMNFVEILSEIAPIICDFKVADVPHVNAMIVEDAFTHSASAVIVHGFMGEDSVRAAVDKAREFGGEVYVVVEMSNPGAVRFMQGIGEDIAKMAVEVGASGVIAPGTRPERIRVYRKIVGDRYILSPGVGAQGGSAINAIKAGATAVIVGRSIYNSQCPRTAAERLVEEIYKNLG
ncbi:MAG: orotidine-5'-phosphate decarboxylase [Thermoplasmata archaeon]|nr:MAG: orotidine-5'-phosphate decarboxylase [Thermoplasmata archaeon]